jgi:serine protease Do
MRRSVLGLLLLICGFTAGLVLTGRMRIADESTAQVPQPGAPGALPAAVPGAAQIGIPSAGLPDFTKVAAATVPAVANISSLQIVRRSTGPFANDPFFRYFFGDDDDLFGSQRGVESSLGSGVVVSADGYILTNNHVVGEQSRLSRGEPQVTVSLADKRELRANIVGIDPASDLALLKVEANNLPTMPWGDSSKLKVAEWVLAIGNPYQLNQSVSLGIVSAVGRRVGISAYEDFIQTDAAINPGNSGGALVNARGELVGINTAIFSQSGGYQGIGFAVPTNLARQVIDDLKKYGEVRRGQIGRLDVLPLTTDIAEQLGMPAGRGVVVTQLSRTSSAYRAGIRPGDVIVSFGGTPVNDVAPLQRAIQDAKIGSAVTVRVIREGRQVDIPVPVESTSQRGPARR